jgi:MFS family permease
MANAASLSAPSSRTEPKSIPVISVAAAVTGNVLEFYDFTTYAFFAVMIGKQFFPATDPLISLLLSVATFGVGFITRPLGGILIGAYGDRAGRKPAMMLTVLLMAVGMLLLALTPSYAAIGPIAPILVVTARLIQGFALGGEVGPATSFLIEAAPPTERGFYASWQLASQGLSAMLAGAVGVTMSAILSPEDMLAWGWRIPFLLGILIIPVGLFMRSKIPETLDLEAPTTHHSVGGVLSALFTENARSVVLALLVIMAGTISTYIVSYMTTYAMTTLHMPAGVAISATMAVGFAIFVFSLLAGWLADKWGRKPLLVVPRLLLILVAYPAFVMMNQSHTASTLLLLSGLMAALGAMSGAVSLVMIPESLPKSVRSAGFSVAYALAVTIFGGTTQLVVTWLIGATGNPLSPAWYLIVSSAVGLVAMLMMTETKGRPLAD